MKIKHISDHAARRRAAYPPLEDFADAIYWSRRGDETRMEAYLVAIDDVKRRFPKPGKPGGK